MQMFSLFNTFMKRVKAVCLFSGGLDSILAVKVLENQGIDVLAVRFVSPFFGSRYLGDPSTLVKGVEEKWQISLKVVDITEDYFPILRAPIHGYGKNFNPCIDCKILMVKKALEIMKIIGARFISTGEVVGQRPMSQRRDTMRIVERESQTEGILLRPLSAKLLPETLPERERLVDRNRMFDFSGRGRKKQMELARSLKITDYPSPSGGCILTDPVLSKRIEYMIKKYKDVDVNDIFLCRIGRHFIWPDGAHLIVPRDQGENESLAALIDSGSYLIKVREFPGPMGLLLGNGISREGLENAGEIVSRYSKARHEKRVDVLIREVDSGRESLLSVTPRWELKDIGCKHL